MFYVEKIFSRIRKKIKNFILYSDYKYVIKLYYQRCCSYIEYLMINRSLVETA